VPRPRLIERISQGATRRLTLVSAPAGFGKTTLLSSWAASQPDPVAWLSLDAGDNEPGRFLSYLIRALAQVTPALSAVVTEAMQATETAQAEAILTGVLNQVAQSLTEGTKARSLALMLDDYHVLEQPRVHETVQFLLNNLPAGCHLIISSRADPPFSLSRLRAQRQLVELRMDDLRFTHDEAEKFLGQLMGLSLSDEHIQTLEQRTEGWIAALQLAAISMQGRADPTSFVRSFAGSHRFVLDFLADEVYQRQPEPLRAFLLQTSILDRLSAGLCNAVAGRSDSQDMLEAVERANLFLLPLDDKRVWFRYHNLFADLLRYRLERTHPDLKPQLHQRAARWYAQNGSIYEAVGHALAAEDFDLVARLVVDSDPTALVMHGHVNTLLGWLDALPDEIIRSNPRLSIAYAWSHFVTLDLEGIEKRVQDALEMLGVADAAFDDRTYTSITPQQRSWLGEIAALKAFVAVNRDRPQEAFQLAEAALRYIPPAQVAVQAALWAALGDACRDTDRLLEAETAYRKVAALSRQLGAEVGSMVALADLARLRVSQGRLREARDQFEEVLRWSEGRLLPQYPIGQTHVGIGDLYREWNDLEKAEYHLQQGISQCEAGGYTRYAIRGYLALARVHHARRAATDRDLALAQAERLSQRLAMPSLASQIADQRLRFRIHEQKPGGALPAIPPAELDAAGQGCALEFHALTLARVPLASASRPADRQALAQVTTLLARLLASAGQAGRTHSVIEIHLLQSLACQAMEWRSAALGVIERTLELAEPEGFLRIFVDEGAALLALLRAALAAGIRPPYVTRLVAALEREARMTPATARAGLPEPLTEREIEILRLLAAGLSYQEITEAAVITMSTVKTHVHHIYDKLGAANRTQAIALAKDLGLLSPRS
jgi:LuxR family maltose regulon positive regulatory protein